MQIINTNWFLLLVFGTVFTQVLFAEKSNHANYIGSASCEECHQKQSKLWRGSHHDLSMQHATKKSVLGNFNNKKYNYNGVTSFFFKKGDQYFIKTDGPKGKLKNYQIKYTFGVDPLQQYLIEFPDGRLQALGIAWDNRAKKNGGKRWYHLYPKQKITYKNRLHWTKADQNWNYMCAECHSTNLQKNYNLKKNSYKTTWSEINVACEACHGPASRHIDWAKKKSAWKSIDQKTKGLVVNLNERSGVTWTIDINSGNAKRSSKKNTHKEIEVCAHCHSRRSVISKKYQPGKSFMDIHRPTILTESLYHPDGQTKDEVYVYGSFLQSKMYHHGVTCSDCHNPHSLKLRAKGNDVCLRCHQKKKYDQAKHHYHKPGSQGAQCVECHMPQTVYMVIDGRHDHSIRIPRPDLSITLKTPNACNQCHQNKSAKWANKKMKRWYGKDWPPGWHYGETLHAARARKIGIGNDLAAVAASPKLPAIVRASALNLLTNYPGPIAFVVVQKMLKAKSPMIRMFALQTLDILPVRHRLKSGGPLLSDPILAIRIEAARILAVVPRNMLSEQLKSATAKSITFIKPKCGSASCSGPTLYTQKVYRQSVD